MPAPRIAKNLPQPAKKQREGMSESHLADVRQCDCLVCGFIGGTGHVQAHHLLRSGEHAMGRRSSDRWTIPLCHEDHRRLHASGDEEGFLSERGYDGRAVASALWAARGDLEAMRRIIFRARQEAALKARREP